MNKQNNKAGCLRPFEELYQLVSAIWRGAPIFMSFVGITKKEVYGGFSKSTSVMVVGQVLKQANGPLVICFIVVKAKLWTVVLKMVPFS